MNTLEFLGTGAADWNIEERCGFFRRNSSAMLNGEILLDAPFHILDYKEECGRADLFSSLRLVLITHDHPDHVSIDALRALAKEHPVTVACDEALAHQLADIEGITYLPLSLDTEHAFDGYRITPVLANHDVILTKDMRAVHYIIRTPDGKTLFYGLDGAWFLRPSWQVMLTHRFDLMVFDCTSGIADDWRIFEHNTIPMLRLLCEEICRRDLLAPCGRLVASHLARTLHADHETTASILQKDNILTAYDGLALTF